MSGVMDEKGKLRHEIKVRVYQSLYYSLIANYGRRPTENEMAYMSRAIDFFQGSGNIAWGTRAGLSQKKFGVWSQYSWWTSPDVLGIDIAANENLWVKIYSDLTDGNVIARSVVNHAWECLRGQWPAVMFDEWGMPSGWLDSIEGGFISSKPNSLVHVAALTGDGAWRTLWE